MKLLPIFNILLRVLLGCGAALISWVGFKNVLGVSLPITVLINITIGSFFASFWFWGFPWASFMHLDALERVRRTTVCASHPGFSGQCSEHQCFLAGSAVMKCIRIVYMIEVTRKRIARLEEGLVRNGGPVALLFLALFIVGAVGAVGATANATSSATPPAAFQAIQGLILLIMMTWSVALVWGEVSVQRLLNHDLTV